MSESLPYRLGVAIVALLFGVGATAPTVHCGCVSGAEGHDSCETRLSTEHCAGKGLSSSDTCTLSLTVEGERLSDRLSPDEETGGTDGKQPPERLSWLTATGAVSSVGSTLRSVHPHVRFEVWLE
jgi:hypothetical protein